MKETDTVLRATWQAFYKKYFGLELDFSNVAIPDYQPDFNRVIIIAQGITMNQVVEVCKEYFEVWAYRDNLNADVAENDRSSAKSAYAIRIRNRVEADEELKNKSANQLKQEEVSGITLLEQLVYGLKYFVETGKHLDVSNYTLCSGSRNSDGYVPRVDWDGDELGVDWSDPDHAVDCLRSRAVVS